MRRKEILFVLILIILQSFSYSYAADVCTDTGSKIKYVLLHSNGTSDTDKIGVVSVVFSEPLNWKNTATGIEVQSCSELHVAIRANDDHLLAAVLSARATNTPVRVYADDSFKLDGANGTICFLRTLLY